MSLFRVCGPLVFKLEKLLTCSFVNPWLPMPMPMRMCAMHILPWNLAL